MKIDKKQKMVNGVKYIFVYSSDEVIHIAKAGEDILSALAHPELRNLYINGLHYKKAKMNIANFLISIGFTEIKNDYAYQKDEITLKRSISSGKWVLVENGTRTIFNSKRELFKHFGYAKEIDEDKKKEVKRRW